MVANEAFEQCLQGVSEVVENEIFKRGEKIFSNATYMIEIAISGSIILGDGVTTLYTARPRVTECAIVKASDCNSTGLSLGLNKNRLSTKRI